MISLTDTTHIQRTGDSVRRAESVARSHVIMSVTLLLYLTTRKRRRTIHYNSLISYLPFREKRQHVKEEQARTSSPRIDGKRLKVRYKKKYYYCNCHQVSNYKTNSLFTIIIWYSTHNVWPTGRGATASCRMYVKLAVCIQVYANRSLLISDLTTIPWNPQISSWMSQRVCL